LAPSQTETIQAYLNKITDEVEIAAIQQDIATLKRLDEVLLSGVEGAEIAELVGDIKFVVGSKIENLYRQRRALMTRLLACLDMPPQPRTTFYRSW
jgi:hypothetical protein